MRRRICAFVVRIWHKQVFSWCGSYEPQHNNTNKVTIWPVRPAKTQISLGICLVWSLFTVHMKKLCANWAHSKDSDKTGPICRLIWVFVGRIFHSVSIWATSWENLFMPYANNKGSDQPMHLCSQHLCYLLPVISLVSKLVISSLYLASVDVQAGLSLIWLQTPKTGFLVTRLIWL